jgi:nucleoside diphosphate kinase
MRFLCAGKDVVKTGRVMLGATNPLASAPGTIRGDYAIDVGRNVCHGSDSYVAACSFHRLTECPHSVESAQKEM